MKFRAMAWRVVSIIKVKPSGPAADAAGAFSKAKMASGLNICFKHQAPPCQAYQLTHEMT